LPSIATPSASRSATTSETARCAGSRSVPPTKPGTSILLASPAADPGITDDERRTIEMMAKGTYGWILLTTADLNGTFEKLQAGGAEVVQEPTEQPYGVRDCAFRDPAGNLIRIQELR
jgi:predicted enzyme related to lactoylglutathione lyase